MHYVFSYCDCQHFINVSSTSGGAVNGQIYNSSPNPNPNPIMIGLSLPLNTNTNPIILTVNPTLNLEL